MKYLFLDDERMPADVTWTLIGGVGSWGATWEIVRSYKEALNWVWDHGFPDVVSFDHDLGYEEYDTTETGIIVVKNAKEEKSGYDFAKFLINFDMNSGSMPTHFRYTVHSMNPEGAKNIQGLLDGYLKFKGILQS